MKGGGWKEEDARGKQTRVYLRIMRGVTLQLADAGIDQASDRVGCVRVPRQRRSEHLLKEASLFARHWPHINRLHNCCGGGGGHGQASNTARLGVTFVNGLYNARACAPSRTRLSCHAQFKCAGVAKQSIRARVQCRTE